MVCDRLHRQIQGKLIGGTEKCRNGTNRCRTTRPEEKKGKTSHRVNRLSHIGRPNYQPKPLKLQIPVFKQPLPPGAKSKKKLKIRIFRLYNQKSVIIFSAIKSQ